MPHQDNTQRGIGQNFLGNISARQRPQANQPSPEEQQLAQQQEQELQQQQKQQEGEAVAGEFLQFASTKLAEAGYEVNDENLFTFISNNRDLSDRSYDFTGLARADDNRKVKPIHEFVFDGVVKAPFMTVLRGGMGVLDAIGEGFSRWEAAKTSFITAQLGEIPGAFAGEKLHSDFADASLRLDDRPELGDLFRAAGLPEVISATGGLALDIGSDMLLGAGIGGAFAQSGKIGARLGLKPISKASKVAKGSKT